ncbi:hypothetical protein LOZ61_002734 [Ophidiomyces ophidiicola]|nr:hypothetical protein LOZ61_002734 [Ophidiomyces ophidiicola]KAI1930318.1 hypothetical protein LOZ60_001101 [Ophidiomyces ophidiicola]KAI1968070.1 hypothetical protein LOZ59_000431 [Ophidiomyces ophidiicola]KAI1975627.1 hypothetical protein LOZ56_000535 [Ophidiomyces ophidiicola]KAI2012152.1 hypothetical protein LOZ49_002857 [Ophidiomyces ophidiicola]
MAPEICPTPRNHSAILYQSNCQNLYVLDIPASISLAQHPRVSSGAAHVDNLEETSTIFSCPPSEIPYSTEPKGAEAMLRVMESIPSCELEYRKQIATFVRETMCELRTNFVGEYCLPRAVQPRLLQRPRKRGRVDGDATVTNAQCSIEPDLSITATCFEADAPPLVLAPGVNMLPGLNSIQTVAVKNNSISAAILQVKNYYTTSADENLLEERMGKTMPFHTERFRVPPQATFVLTHLPTEPNHLPELPIIFFNGEIFDFILMDPPWPNRSVRRSAHYQTTPTFNHLQTLLCGILERNLRPEVGIAAIWTTNNVNSRSTARESLENSGLQVFEEWIWVKTTSKGVPVSPICGLWRQPYEVLILGRRPSNAQDEKPTVRRRVIVGVPDIHSRKPHLKELVEQHFFNADYLEGYKALEVFARNLTAGWWSCGDEVLRFNWDGWWA